MKIYQKIKTKNLSYSCTKMKYCMKKMIREKIKRTKKSRSCHLIQTPSKSFWFQKEYLLESWMPAKTPQRSWILQKECKENLTTEIPNLLVMESRNPKIQKVKRSMTIQLIQASLIIRADKSFLLPKADKNLFQIVKALSSVKNYLSLGKKGFQSIKRILWLDPWKQAKNGSTKMKIETILKVKMKSPMPEKRTFI